MARWPGSRWRPVTRYLAGNSHAFPIEGPRRLIYHTAVSGSESLHGWMNQLGNPVSHFYVGAATAEQYIDTDLISTANLQGNIDCITVETRDTGGPFPSWSGSNVPAWTDWQVRKLSELAAWCHEEHGIPLTLLPDSKSGRRGVGYHRLGIDPWRVSGGENWSSSFGKVCPGDRRIAQIPTIINLAQEDDMTPAELRAELDRFFGAGALTYNDAPISRDMAMQRAAQWSGGNANHLRYRVLPELAAIRAAAADDPAAVAAHLAPLVIPPVVAAVGAAGGLTAEQVEEAAEKALRDVLREGVDET